MVEKKEEKLPEVTVLADEVLNSAVGGVGVDPADYFWGGDCHDCGWHCRCSTQPEAKRLIDAHKATGHLVTWVTNAPY